MSHTSSFSHRSVPFLISSASHLTHLICRTSAHMCETNRRVSDNAYLYERRVRAKKTHICATMHTEDTHLCDNAHFYERMQASVRKYTLLWENALWMIALAWDLVDGIMDNALLLVRPHCTHLWDNPLVWDNAFVWDIAFVSWMKRCFDSDVSWFHGWSAALIETSIPQWLHSRGCAKSHISTMSPTSATIEVLRYWGRISRGALSTQSWEQHTLQHTTTHRNTHCSALQHTLETRARVALVSLLLSFSRMLL